MSSATKSLFDSLRPKKRQREPSGEVVDQTLDDALKALTEATRRNEAAVRQVRRRQSSGQLKLVNVPGE
jgi:hypothetical protein